MTGKHKGKKKKQEKEREREPIKEIYEGSNVRGMTTVTTSEVPGTLVSHSPLTAMPVSPFELAIIKCACIYSDIWRTKALCKSKCKICRVTTQR